jgi:GNAT superfamily N-acetyltransferase
MTAQLKIAALADYPHAAPILARWCYDEWGRDDGLSLQDELNRFDRALRAPDLPQVVIALDGDAAVGCAQLKTADVPRYPELVYWLGGVYVTASHRGHGIAASLIDAVVQRARQHGVQHLHLQTDVLSGGLYRRLGWTPMFQTTNHGVEVLVMRRALS